MNKKISVIIPFYNCIDFLPRQLDSILSGTIVPHEILLIDDGSTDSSKSVALEYAKKYPCISVLSQGHKGVSTARNLGLSKSTGDWISFLDADDYVDPDMFNLMLKALASEKTVYDGCICGYSTHKAGTITSYIPAASESMSSKELLKAMFTDEAVKGFLFTRLFRTDLLKDISFNEDVSLCEDLLFQTQLFSSKDITFAVIPSPLYNYVQNDSSLTSRKQFFTNGVFRYKQAFELIKKNISYAYVEESYNSILEYSMYTLLKSYQEEKLPETLKQIRLMQKEIISSKSFTKKNQEKSKRRLAFTIAPIFYSFFMK